MAIHENIRSIGYPQLPFVFTRPANFKDVGMCQTAPWFSCTVGAEEGCVLSISCSFHHASLLWAHACVPYACCTTVGRIFPLPLPSFWCESHPGGASNCLCERMEQLTPSVGNTHPEGYAWELIRNGKTYLGSQLFNSVESWSFYRQFCSVKLPVMCCVSCNCSARK